MHSSLISPRKAFSLAWNSALVRNVALVGSGTAGAQAITMAFSPVITRIYGPEAFGLPIPLPSSYRRMSVKRLVW